MIRNPFTGAVRHAPGTGEVEIRIDGHVLGAIEPSADFESDGDLHVFSPTSEVTDVVRQVINVAAVALSGIVVWV